MGHAGGGSDQSMFMWMNENGASMTVFFKDGKVEEKLHMGLR
jgi:hypothetical protein